MSYVGQSVHHTILVGASIVLAPDGLLLGTVLAQEIKSYSSVVSNTETVPDQNTGTRETSILRCPAWNADREMVARSGKRSCLPSRRR